MDGRINNRLFTDFIACKHKAYLRLVGAPGYNSPFEELERQLSLDYRDQVFNKLRRNYSANEVAPASTPLALLLCRKYHLATDVTITEGDLVVQIDALILTSATDGVSQPIYIPVIFGHHEKTSRTQKLLLACWASALAVHQGVEPPFGKIIHGRRFRSSKVDIGRLIGEADQIVGKIRTIKHTSDRSLLHLNAHCTTCEFKKGCNLTASKDDNLSLLRGIKAKEVMKLNKRGIFTVTQLSYMFRPRKKSRRSNPEKIKYYHSLKALAVREKRIYVIGTPKLDLTGTPVYIDVEGIPDQDFYYLIGLRVADTKSYVKYSFWAEDSAEEQKIWDDCLNAIATIDNPQLLHYGSYETTFLKRMAKRYGDTAPEGVLLHKLIAEARNVVSVIYGRIYFPTYSNSLKDVAPFLGYKWSHEDASGEQSLWWRHNWESTRSIRIKEELIKYNAEDCEALEVVVKAVQQLIPKESSSTRTLSHRNATHVDSLEPEKPYHWGPVDFVFPQLEYVNKCAYWNYQRDRIYIRTNALVRRSTRRNKRQTKKYRSLRINRIVSASKRRKCPECDSRRIEMNGRHNRLLYDLRFSDGCVKRWITKHCIVHYKCNDCSTHFASDQYNLTKHRYGRHLLAYVIYSLIELHISQPKIATCVNRLFGYPLTQSSVNRLKARAVALYRETYETIKRDLLGGKLIHADETRMSTRSGGGYVWVFTSMENVVYLWSETREGHIATNFLGGFEGILVSDFYSAYDSINCPQQRCLIHLIRDLNDDVLKEPFNEELKALVLDFADLLKTIIGTVDRFGLKTHFLKKHKKEVTQFYGRLSAGDYQTEIAQKAWERLKKNQHRLFTFLDHDGVPWNNNNAEHAIKAFAPLRDEIQGSTNERGLRDYLILLSICQTCVYKGIDFLSFVLSEEKNIDKFIDRSNGRGCGRGPR